ncbi:hypothetical protein GCM10011415_07630 [Salipiger pallidus]|uniref:Uncharacterized protein n=1 Tax=Salipiger pallidus TaxID=1775170 RepID=A0A8J3EFF2_9RHOB|nr:hypothetical protein [Salipiger pallidus]GGG63641.1 hypothetical protein GCM10011415_07630 [Salipiger pallidus]
MRHDISEDWSVWRLHDGKGCPLPPGTIAEVVSEDGFGYTARQVARVTGGGYSSWNWDHYPELKRITRYRVRKPRGLYLLEERMRDVKDPALT